MGIHQNGPAHAHEHEYEVDDAVAVEEGVDRDLQKRDLKAARARERGRSRQRELHTTGECMRATASARAYGVTMTVYASAPIIWRGGLGPRTRSARQRAAMRANAVTRKTPQTQQVCRTNAAALENNGAAQHTPRH